MSPNRLPSAPPIDGAAPLPAPARDVIGALSRLVVERGLRPGDRLPDERALARQLGVSRSTIREGLRYWEGMNVIARRQGSGTWLRIAVGPDSVALGAGLVDVSDARALVHTLEVRRALEGEAAAICAERASPEDRTAILRALEVMEHHQARYGGSPRSDLTLHETIWRAAGNPVLERLVTTLGRSLKRIWENPVGTHDFAKASFPFHRTMVEAILAGDPLAARAEAHKLVESVIADVRRATRPSAVEDAR